jgi:6,7-dimethyl-8-ribityllumazine synthase
MHFEYIAETTSHALMNIGLELNKPVIFGVLTCLTEEQALERAGLTSNGHNHAVEWAQAAIEMALLK